MAKQHTHGVIKHDKINRKTDYLYRISIKGVIRNEKGEVLVVKEAGRTYWDLPGGGMDHGEDLRTAIAREMKEEVNLNGSFNFRILHVDEPTYLENHDFWQVRLIFEIKPQILSFSPGEDSDETSFVNPQQLKDSNEDVERLIYYYSRL